MKKIKFLSAIIAAVLIVCIVFSGRGVSYLSAETQQDKELEVQYLSEVKMFYAESAEQAKKYCEAEGYIFSPENLKEESSSDLQAYLGYKTTEDKGDAITDMTLLDMKNSHWSDMTYAEFLDKHVGDFADQANRVMIMVNEFRKKYAQGSPNALAAYDTLNMFYIDEEKSHKNTDNLLGTFILEQADVAFFEKYIQRGNSQIFSAVLAALGGATTDFEEDGKTWVERSKESDIAQLYAEADSAERNQYDTWYKDPALTFIRDIQTFADTYHEAVEKREKYGDAFGYTEKDGIDEESTLDEILETDPNCRIPEYVNALMTYDLLDGYAYNEDLSLAEYFLQLAADENIGVHPEAVYPIMASMSAAQRETVNLCGISVLAKSMYQIENYESERKELLQKAAADLKKYGFSEGKIYLWANVDQSLYNKKVAETSDKIEAENAGDALTNSTNEAARKAVSDLTMALRIVDIVLLFLSGTFMIVQACVGVSLWAVGMTCYMMAASLAFTAGITALSIGWAIAGTLACVCFVLSIIVLIASLAYMVYMIMDMCGVFDEPEKADYSKIPDILFHVRKNSTGSYQVRYDAVTSNATLETIYEIMLRSGKLEKSDQPDYVPGTGGFDFVDKFVDDVIDSEEEQIRRQVNLYYSDYLRSDVSDVGAYQGRYDRWIALYTTKAPVCGKPIEVIPGQSIIKTQLEDYHAPNGTKKVTLVGGSDAADINSIEINGKVGTPLFMFLIKSPNPEEPEPEETSHETKETDQYITRVRLAHASKREDAVNSLKKDGFSDIIDVNLTPYDGYTFLGYQLGSRSGALTDLRVSTMGTDPIVHGDASYARVGIAEQGMTPDGMSLYATTSKTAGTPIKRISVETKRLELGSGAEPVCLFSGGNAVDFKHKWSDNLFFNIGTYEYLMERESVAVRQDDPAEGGLYIYFWPETEYKAPNKDSKAPYVSGFSYFMAASDTTGDNRFGTHRQFMQKFASANGFELVKDGDQPKKMMSDKAAKMNPLAIWFDREGGALGIDWTYDLYHYMSYCYAGNFSDGATGDHSILDKVRNEETRQSTLYFGVSYTYNPYRAVTGIAGLISPYTERSGALRFTGLRTPAGTMQCSNVSIQGNPVTQPGICYGYFSYTNMPTSWYPNHDAKQRSSIPWLSGGDTEILSHYLLTSGPTAGRKPIKRDDLKFVSSENPGQIDGYVPLCDLRTPGDYDHPMNLALDTTNLGSEYLYMFMKTDAGGREKESGGSFNKYQKKHYVAGIFCGTGKTPEEAINSLYAKATERWAGLAAAFPDISATPLVTEFDEILPVDLSDTRPWYERYRRDISGTNPSDNEWVYGNDGADLRWAHAQYKKNPFSGSVYAPSHLPDDKEKTRDYAYIGVVRTNYSEEVATITETKEDGTTETTEQTVFPAYGILKYYNDSASSVLTVGHVKCILAGGPIKSKEGDYYLYYSTNSATAPFSAPITEIDLSEEAFINGYNTSLSCSESDRVDHVLPEYSTLRMRTDEYKYIHTKYDMADLPYIEHIYLGIGNNKKEAYADLIGTTNANAATDVNCNYNSHSDKWIAIGYRRTADSSLAVRDFFLYAGEDPPDEVQIDGYKITETKKGGKVTTATKAAKIPYKLIKHNLKTGAEALSLNEGGGSGLYLYYGGRSRFAYENDPSKEISPIRNITFGYGDISPKYASAEELAEVFGETVHGMRNFDLEAYRDPVWEYVLGISGSPENYKIDSSNGSVMSLNYGQRPMRGNSKRHTGDKRVIMYVDHAPFNGAAPEYQIRSNAALSNAGYYSATSQYGVLTQTN